VVERRVPLRQHPVLIAFVGIAPGVGTTTLALAAASHIARSGQECALVEASEPSLALASGNLGPGQSWSAHLNVWSGAGPEGPREVARARAHPYVVGDMGCLGIEAAAAFESDLTVLVLPPEALRAQRVLAWLLPHSGGLPILSSDAQLDIEQKRRLWQQRQEAEESDRRATAALAARAPNLRAAVLAVQRWQEIAALWEGLWQIPGRPEVAAFGVRLGAGLPPRGPEMDKDLAVLLEPVLPEPSAGAGSGVFKGLRRKGQGLLGGIGARKKAAEASTDA
jgi:hypothetical protein